MVKIAPSILSADFSCLGSEIEKVDNAGADYIHVDVMDGRFVPNITIGPSVIKSIRKTTKIPFDVHLMIVEPERYIENFVEAGSDIITVHVEASSHLHRLIQRIKNMGIKAGVAINPGTSPHALDSIIEYADLILVMTVNPGFGGQSFIPSVLHKISYIKKLILDMGLSTEIEVDGGIASDTIFEAAGAGADIFVAGTAVFGGTDYKGIITELRMTAEKAVFAGINCHC